MLLKAPWIMAAALGLFLGVLVVRSVKKSPERETAELLDSIIQPRFQVTNGLNFGVSRVVPPTPGHSMENGFQPENDVERQVLAQVSLLDCDYSLGFVHMGYYHNHDPRREERFRGNQKIPNLELILGHEKLGKLSNRENYALLEENIISTVGPDHPSFFMRGLKRVAGGKG